MRGGKKTAEPLSLPLPQVVAVKKPFCPFFLPRKRTNAHMLLIDRPISPPPPNPTRPPYPQSTYIQTVQASTVRYIILLCELASRRSAGNRTLASRYGTISPTCIGTSPPASPGPEGKCSISFRLKHRLPRRLGLIPGVYASAFGTASTSCHRHFVYDR